MDTTAETNSQVPLSRADTTWDSLQENHRTFIKYDLRGISDESIVTVGTEKRLSLQDVITKAVKVSKSVQEFNKGDREAKEKNKVLRGLKAVWLTFRGKDDPMRMFALVKQNLGTLLPRTVEASSDPFVRIM
jgi:hypothetical protein